MSFSVTIDKKQLESLIGKLEKFSNRITGKDIMNLISVQVKNLIRANTQGGKDKDGKSFKPYSARYSKKEGKSLVNLTNSGTMINAMTQKVLSNTMAKVFFINAAYKNGSTVQEVAKAHIEGLRHLPIRDFFGLSDFNASQVQKEYQKETAQAIKDLKL
jgi:phage gpG-like protein